MDARGARGAWRRRSAESWRQRLDELWSDQTEPSVSARLLRLGLSSAASTYGVLTDARNAAYRSGLFHSARVPVPVISVGNITTGGTGKTPMVEWVSRRLLERGRRPALLSRGYRAQGEFNDEARQLAECLPDIPHVQMPDRCRAAHLAIADHGADALVLDDGFQHRRLHRDLDLVLLDALDPFGMGRLLPAGLLREPLKNLRRADALLLTRADQKGADERDEIKTKALRYAGNKPWIEVEFRPTRFLEHGGGSRPIERLANIGAMAFCGLGNPNGFAQTVKALGFKRVEARFFPDHHHYDEADLATIVQTARQSKCDLIICSHKDLVKLRTFPPTDPPIVAVAIEPLVTVGQEMLESLIDRALSSSEDMRTSH